MGTKSNHDAASTANAVNGEGVAPGMVTKIFDRVRAIKRAHPDLSRRVDALEARVRDNLMAIKDTVDEFPEHERELVKVLVINGMHKMCDEILIDDPTDIDAASADDTASAGAPDSE